MAVLRAALSLRSYAWPGTPTTRSSARSATISASASSVPSAHARAARVRRSMQARNRLLAPSTAPTAIITTITTTAPISLPEATPAIGPSISRPCATSCLSFRRQSSAPRTIGTRWAADHGLDRLQLYVTAGNERAKRFYARCGLRPTQEIWRIDLTPAPGVIPPADPSCAHSGHAAQQIELGHHHLAMEFSDES